MIIYSNRQLRKMSTFFSFVNKVIIWLTKKTYKPLYVYHFYFSIIIQLAIFQSFHSIKTCSQDIHPKIIFVFTEQTKVILTPMYMMPLLKEKSAIWRANVWGPTVTCKVSIMLFSLGITAAPLFFHEFLSMSEYGGCLLIYNLWAQCVCLCVRWTDNPNQQPSMINEQPLHQTPKTHPDTWA